MANLTELVEDFNKMIADGKIMDAFEKYYSEDVVMQENDYPATVGKDANRERELEFFGNVTAFRKGDILNVLVSDGLVVTETHYDYSHKVYGERNFVQLAVQRWKDDKIVYEKFYYNN